MSKEFFIMGATVEMSLYIGLLKTCMNSVAIEEPSGTYKRVDDIKDYIVP